MSRRTRNEFLDDDDSGDDAYNSDHSERLAKGRVASTGRAAKRHKLDTSDDGEAELSEDDNADREDSVAASPRNDELTKTKVGEDLRQSILPPSNLPSAISKSAAKAEKAARKSGVLYISRVPPFMKPHTLKHLLEPHAPKGIGRIFLTPEDHNSYLRRKKSGGNKKKSFTDGWIEFVSKTEAKIAAETLNGNIMGGKKRGYYHDDLWNIKYLSGFKWSNLTDQIAAENAEREARMREEIRKTRKENKAFLEDYERGKMLETMEKKEKAKTAKGLAGSGDQRTSNKSRAREFKQSKARHAEDREKSSDDAALKRTLSMIF